MNKKIILGTAQFIKNYSLFKKIFLTTKKEKFCNILIGAAVDFLRYAKLWRLRKLLGKKLKNKKLYGSYQNCPRITIILKDGYTIL